MQNEKHKIRSKINIYVQWEKKSQHITDFFFKLENNIDIKKFKNVRTHIDNILIVNWLKT